MRCASARAELLRPDGLGSRRDRARAGHFGRHKHCEKDESADAHGATICGAAVAELLGLRGRRSARRRDRRPRATPRRELRAGAATTPQAAEPRRARPATHRGRPERRRRLPSGGTAAGRRVVRGPRSWRRCVPISRGRAPSRGTAENAQIVDQRHFGQRSPRVDPRASDSGPGPSLERLTALPPEVASMRLRPFGEAVQGRASVSEPANRRAPRNPALRRQIHATGCQGVNGPGRI